MIAHRAGATLVILLATGLWTACGGGGGGSHPTATPTMVPPSATPTNTPTPAAAVDVFSLFPPVGPAAGGTPLLIEGAGFTGGGTVAVAFGEAPAGNVIVLNDTELSCLTPAGDPGSIVSVRVTSSKGTDSLPGAFRYGGGGGEDTLNVELSGEPTVTFDGAIGTTTVLVDYLVRDSEGVLLDESDINVTMFVDGEQLGAGGRFGESVLDSDAKELDLSVLVLLVLDASYSLQQFDPPQFNAMLKAADRLVGTGENIWRNRGGAFDWNVVWFDELISRPDPDHMRSFRIGNIPPPEPGNFTKLYSAISNGLDFSSSLFAQGIAAGPRDRHVVVVFTDGLDNLSAFGNPEVMREGELRNGDPYPRVGWRATALENVLGEIAAHPRYPANLTVHSIALGAACSAEPEGGACFDGEALGDIAQVGFGQLLASPRDVDDLFDLIQREFTTLQSSGAVMALGPDEYEFRLVAERRNHSAGGEIEFRFRVDSNGAELIPF